MRDGLDELKARQEAARRARAAAERNTGNERAAHIDAAAIANCHLCDDDGYRGLRVCDHTDHAAAARHGMALVRRVMGWNNHRPTTTENHRPAPTPPTTPRSPVGTPFRHQNDAEEDRL